MSAFWKILVLQQLILCAEIAIGADQGENINYAELTDKSGRRVGDLLSLLMRETGACEGDSRSGGELQAFVLSLQPEQRKAFTDLLDIVLRGSGTVLSSEEQDLGIFTLPPGQEVRELVRTILGQVEKKPAGEETNLQSVVLSDKKAALDTGPTVNQTINNLINDFKANKLGIYNFA